MIECRSPVHRCRRCGHCFIPAAYRNLDKHFHSLKSWAMYLHVAHQISFGTLEELFREMFNLNVFDTEILTFKTLLARMYRPTYRKLMEKILAGQVVHVDETEVKLKTGKGYVWVFASLEEVVYMFRPTREGGFLQELLKDFHGVLVSDFYAAYDAIDCPQQKCLIHLMRDINQDLLNNPFDEELRSITQPFATLLQSIVSTVDQHGLKRRHLMAHEKEVESFFRLLSEKILLLRGRRVAPGAIPQVSGEALHFHPLRWCPLEQQQRRERHQEICLLSRGHSRDHDRSRPERLLGPPEYLPDLPIQGDQFLEVPSLKGD